MKKLTFMNVKGQELTREEMRNVMAGCGGSVIIGSNECCITCPPQSGYGMVCCDGINYCFPNPTEGYVDCDGYKNWCYPMSV